MARSYESLWLWLGAGFIAVGAALLGVAGGFDAASKVPYSFVTSVPVIVAYVMFVLSLACFTCAIREVPIPYPVSRRITVQLAARAEAPTIERASLPALPGPVVLPQLASVLTDALNTARSITEEGLKATVLIVIAEAVAATDPDRAARLTADAERIAQSITDRYTKALALARAAEAVTVAMKPMRNSQDRGHRPHRRRRGRPRPGPAGPGPGHRRGAARPAGGTPSAAGRA